MNAIRRLRPLDLTWVLPWTVLAVAAIQPIRDNSFLWHVRAGSVQIVDGSVLTADPFSFTRAGASWRTQSWLAELAFGWLDVRMGLAFVPSVVFAAFAVVFLGVWLLAREANRSPLVPAAIMLAAAWTGAAFMNPRPAVFSFGLIVLVLLASRPKLRWALPLLMWVWASVHASFALGFIIVCAESLRRTRAIPWRDLVPMGVATLLTAHGIGVVEFLLGFVRSSGALDHLSEWRTPSFVSLPFLLVIPIVLALFAGAARGRLDLSELWIVGPALFLLASSVRAVLPGFLLLLPSLARSLGEFRVVRGRTSSRESELLAVLGIGLLIGFPSALRSAELFEEGRFPVVAAGHLESDRPYSDDVASAFLIYSTWPEHGVFVDDRAELYGAAFFADALEVRSGTPTWQEVFTAYEIDEALVRVDDGLAVELIAAGWREQHRDEHFLVLSRPDSG
ncbi:MAG: hypothetical protein WD532_08140 [Acidimicrobiia bacterium]